ncbi:MAG: hypothetical protein L0Z50_11015, partial [Verrucomicrobiales bacterium]|nr:hypothetical protein [Verrucomicrobiales bacterium]
MKRSETSVTLTGNAPKLRPHPRRWRNGRRRGGDPGGRPTSGRRSILKSLPIDPWRLGDALYRRAVWIILGSLGVAMIGFNWAYLAASCSAAVKLVRTVPAGMAALKLEEQALGLREQSLQATLDLLRSPDLMRRVVGAAQLRLTPEDVAARSRISAGLPTDPITITYRGSRPTEAVQVVNAYAREAIELSAEWQREELKQITGFLAARLSETDAALKESGRKLIESGTLTGA